MLPQNLSNDLAQSDAGWYLGCEIRKLRKARGLSLADMASHIGKSVSYCSNVERGSVSPSIVDLTGISMLLGVSLSWFFAHEKVVAHERGRVVRGNSRRQLGTISTGLTEELLSPDVGGTFETFLTTIGPGAEAEKFKLRDTEEEGYVVHGSLDLWIGEHAFTVHAGDSFRIAREPFRWRNPTTLQVVIVWIVAPPVY